MPGTWGDGSNSRSAQTPQGTSPHLLKGFEASFSIFKLGDCDKISEPHQSILKEINPEYSREGLMLKLKLQYFDYLMQRVNQGTDPDAGKD